MTGSFLIGLNEIINQPSETKQIKGFKLENIFQKSACTSKNDVLSYR